MNQNEQVVDQKVINRIRKMLSMANGTAAGGEHERDTAMKMAVKLMAQHNLSMHDMAAKHGAKEEGRIKEEVLYRDEPWARTIVNAVSKLFFCALYTQRRNKDIAYVFIGRESNVQTAKEMAAYLIDSVAKESRKMSVTGGSSANKTSFRKGAAHKIWERALKLKADAEKESADEAARAPGTSLVLASLYKQEEQANENMLVTLGVKLVQKTARTSKKVNVTAYQAGLAYGSSVGLNKQVK